MEGSVMTLHQWVRLREIVRSHRARQSTFRWRMRSRKAIGIYQSAPDRVKESSPDHSRFEEGAYLPSESEIRKQCKWFQQHWGSDRWPQVRRYGWSIPECVVCTRFGDGRYSERPNNLADCPYWMHEISSPSELTQ